MKLSYLHESVTNNTQKVLQLLRRAGIDITSPAVRKLIGFLPNSHGIAGGGGREAETLENNTRLVAWLDRPLPGYDCIKRGTKGFLVFRPEHRDVAELLASVPNGSPVSDLLNGLAFGYAPHNVLPWQGERALGNKVHSWLSSIGFDVEGVVLHQGELAVVNADIPDIHRLKQLLDSLGIEPAPVPNGWNTEYNVAIRIADMPLAPGGLESSTLSHEFLW